MERLSISSFSDVPERKADFVSGRYELIAPKDQTTVAVKVIDMLGEEVLVALVPSKATYFPTASFKKIHINKWRCDGVVLFDHRGSVRGRLGDRTEIYRGVDAALAQRGNGGGDGDQRVAPGSRVKDDTNRHRLCGLDGHRRSGHGARGDSVVRRIAGCSSDAVHPADYRRDHRLETLLQPLAGFIHVPNFGILALAENGRLISVVFELQQVV